MIDRTRIDRKIGEYGVAGANALSDPGLLPRVQEAKRILASRMRPVGRDEIVKQIPPGDYHVSRKLDGVFEVLVLDEGEVFSVNPSGTVRVGLPLHAEAKQQLEAAGLTRALVVGEIYVTKDGRPGRLHDVLPVLRTPASREELAKLRFGVFDLLEPFAGPYTETWKRIQGIFGGGTLAHAVEATWVHKLDVLAKTYEKWVETEHAEGIVARSDAAGQFKIKPRMSLDVVVVGFTEGMDDRRGMIHDLLCALVRPDGTYQLVGRVGGGFTDEERRAFTSDLRDLATASDYTEVNPDHLAYQMVRPELVIEVSCLDLLAETTRGGPIERMVLSWNGPAAKYEIVRRLPLAALIGPSYVRRRPDKSVNPRDLRLSQVTDVVEVPLADKDATRLTLSPSELLRREVYVKTLRGAKMVRKLLLWKTNKERDTAEHPAYVVYLTDFSPNRQSPLEREIRVASTPEAAERLWGELHAKYVVGGWVKV